MAKSERAGVRAAIATQRFTARVTSSILLYSSQITLCARMKRLSASQRSQLVFHLLIYLLDFGSYIFPCCSVMLQKKSDVDMWEECSTYIKSFVIEMSSYVLAVMCGIINVMNIISVLGIVSHYGCNWSLFSRSIKHRSIKHLSLCINPHGPNCGSLTVVGTVQSLGHLKH